MNASRLGNQIGSSFPQVMLLILSSLVAITLMFMVGFGLSFGKTYHAVVVLVGCALPVGFCLYCFWVALRQQRLFERGVKIGGRSLSFDEIEYYTLTSMEEYINHIYVHSLTQMTFVPYADSGQSKLRLTWSAFFRSQTGIEGFIGNLAMFVQQRMRDKLREEGKVAWTDKVFFEEEGLRYEPKNGATVVALYEDLEISATEGLWGKGIVIRDKKRQARIGKFLAKSPNYLSCILLLEELSAARQPATTGY